MVNEVGVGSPSARRPRWTPRRRFLLLVAVAVLVTAWPLANWAIRSDRNRRLLLAYDRISTGAALDTVPDGLGIPEEVIGYPDGSSVTTIRDDAGDVAPAATAAYSLGGSYQIVVYFDPATKVIRGKQLRYVRRPPGWQSDFFRWFPV